MQKPFEGILGNSTELRLLEYLMPLSGIEFNITELAEETGVSRPTITRIVKKFVKQGILLARVDQFTQYSINPASPIVKTMEQLNNIIIESMLGEEALTEIGQYWAKRDIATGTVPEYGLAGTVMNAAETQYQIGLTPIQEENRYNLYNAKACIDSVWGSAETGFNEPLKTIPRRFLSPMTVGSGA